MNFHYLQLANRCICPTCTTFHYFWLIAIIFFIVGIIEGDTLIFINFFINFFIIWHILFIILIIWKNQGKQWLSVSAVIWFIYYIIVFIWELSRQLLLLQLLGLLLLLLLFMTVFLSQWFLMTGIDPAVSVRLWVICWVL